MVKTAKRHLFPWIMGVDCCCRQGGYTKVDATHPNRIPCNAWDPEFSGTQLNSYTKWSGPHALHGDCSNRKKWNCTHRGISYHPFVPVDPACLSLPLSSSVNLHDRPPSRHFAIFSKTTLFQANTQRVKRIGNWYVLCFMQKVPPA